MIQFKRQVSLSDGRTLDVIGMSVRARWFGMFESEMAFHGVIVVWPDFEYALTEWALLIHGSHVKP